MTEEPTVSRFATELELLQAMYPEQLAFDARSRDLKFSDGAALLHLRIPESYPDAGVPDVLEACDAKKNDVRDGLKARLGELQLALGEEVLDAVLGGFQQLVSGQATNGIASDGTTNEMHEETENKRESKNKDKEEEKDKTVIIWLHHLLALSKRKLAVSPASPHVAGITKPGYPGVMVFSGPAGAVGAHVEALKRENWQAFQVRFEDDVGWEFGHCAGAGAGAKVVEVESMSEVVKGVEVGKEAKGQKEEFLRAVGIK